ncbi:MAG: multiheme c-type cytochrome [Bryobacteraceae bacterium]|jgi:hypothetical protein
MGHALLSGADSLVLNGHRELSFRKGAYSYTIQRRGDEIVYSVTDGTGTISVPLNWTVGAHAHTFVLEYDGRLYESLVTYYPSIDSLDITTGDEGLRPGTLLQALGRRLDDRESQKCFGCHATGAVSGGSLRLDALTPGVRCEHCHAGASRHMEAITHGDARVIPPKLESLSPWEMSNFCGQCHRTWEEVMRGQLWGPFDVRFQPYRMANSKCFDGADRRLSCLACHDPHREVVQDAGSYDAKCLACHDANARARSAQSSGPGSAARKSCPVAGANCVTCHMPKVDVPGLHQPFTDHQIRIVRAEDAYPD